MHAVCQGQKKLRSLPPHRPTFRRRTEGSHCSLADISMHAHGQHNLELLHFFFSPRSRRQ